MRCEVLRPGALAEVEADWSALASRYRNAPFLHIDFIRSLLGTFADGSERLVRVASGDGVVAVGIFRRRGPMWETFQPTQIPIGCIVVRPDVAWADLLPVIASALPGITLGVGVTQQDPSSCPRPVDGGKIVTLDYIATAWIDLAGTFEDYWSARGKNLRQNLRKQRRKLADDGVKVTLDVLATPAEVAAGIADYASLETAGWKAGGGTAISPDNDQGRFYKAMLESFCARGCGRIYRYRFDDRIVAVDLCIESADTIVVLKTTYDESIRAFSPAALMREEVFPALWASGHIRHIEFFGRVMEWHTRWSEQVRTMYHVTWHRWPALARAATRLRQRTRPPGETPAASDPPAQA
jgi:Acetyltransferase (GNAT) domain